VAFAAFNKLLYHKPLWLNVQDLSADAAAASGIARGRLVKRCLSAIQSLMFNRADVWSSISPVMIDRLKAIRKRNQPILYLPNWLNSSMAAEIARFPSKLGRLPSDPVKLLYAGNIGGKQDLLRFCQALRGTDVRFQFRIHGDGAEASTVQRWVERATDQRFAFGPFLEEHDFAAALHETDLFVIIEKAGSGGSFIPCKMIAGIASGSPILAVCDADSPLGLEMQTCSPGPALSWESLSDIAAILRELHLSPGAFEVWQHNALSRATFYTRDLIIHGFDAAIRAIVAGDTPSEHSIATNGRKAVTGE
jgi:colanic acid biosynthesis glycosyl transferase WcaI